MHPITFNDFADSPTLLLSPQHHPFCAASSYAHSYPYHTFVPIMPPSPSGCGPNRTPPTAPIPTPPNSSRKRQRDTPSLQMSTKSSVDENGDTDMRLAPARTPAISPEPLHSEGMSTINPLTGQQGSAGARSESWFESTMLEKLGPGTEAGPDQVDGSASQEAKRQCVREEPSSNIIDFAKVTPQTQSRHARSHLRPTQADEYTHILGVGWTKLGDDPHFLAAVRGYCRYIENHYSLTNAEILAKSSSLDSYLVKTSGGYYLFNEKLTEGRLIARDLEVTLERLQSSEIQFDCAYPIHPANTSGGDPSKDNGTEISETERADAADDVPMV